MQTLRPILLSSIVAVLFAVSTSPHSVLAGDPGMDYVIDTPTLEERTGRVASPTAVLECAGGILSTSWDDAGMAGVRFRAVGRKPDWTLEFDQGSCLRFVIHHTALSVFATVPDDIDVKTGGLIYGARTKAHELGVGIERRGCRDDASAAALSHTVTVRLDGKEYLGCGRALMSELVDLR